jgi:hypothetical protein
MDDRDPLPEGFGVGRHHIDKPHLKLPPLGATEESVRRYLAAVAKHVAIGDLSPRHADVLIKAAKGALAAIRDKHKRDEVEELKKLLAAAEAMNRAGLAHEAAERSHAAGTAHADSPGDPGPAKDR